MGWGRGTGCWIAKGSEGVKLLSREMAGLGEEGPEDT